MGVENKYVEVNIFAGKLAAAAAAQGAEVRKSIITFETAVADAAGSVYRIIKGINPDAIISDIKIYNDAIAGADDTDVGFYETLDDNGAGGAEIDKNVLADDLDLSSANPINSPEFGLEYLNVADYGKRVYEICGHTQATKKRSYDLALTVNSEITAAATITVEVTWIQG